MRLIATALGIVAVVALLVLLPAAIARRAARGWAWIALAAYAIGLVLAGYALLAAGMCGAAETDPCDAGRPLELSIAPALVAVAAFAALVVLARRRA